MKKINKTIIYCVVPFLFLLGCQTSSPDSGIKSLTSFTMRITSSAFTEGGTIPSKYTCDGDNINPTLEISGVPEESKSLVLIVHDPDAPKTGGFTHWVLTNIDPSTNEIKENSVPDGAMQSETDFGNSGWGGPCPPSGSHRYNFKLYALDTRLEANPTLTKDEIEKMMDSHILADASLMGTYQRQ